MSGVPTRAQITITGARISGDPEFRELFVDKARNTSAVEHANVVVLDDSGEVDSLLWLAVRLVDGSDLAEPVDDGPCALAPVSALLDEVVDGLDARHGQGAVYRDSGQQAGLLDVAAGLCSG